MATTRTANNESKNAANNAASVATSKSANASRIIVAGIPKPADKQQAAPAEQPRELTAEAKAAQLQKEIESKTAALQAALKELQHKKELSDHRTRFIKALDQLDEVETKLNETDEFQAPNSRIAFESKPGYNWEAIFTIGSAELQKEFITFIRAKIRAKVESIEAELIK